MNEQFILPSPWMPLDLSQRSRAAGDWGAYGSAVWPVANDAIFVPFVFPADCTLTALHALGSNTTGNYDLGLYGTDSARISSKGSTAMAAAVLTHTLPDIRVRAGELYHVALVCSSGSGSLVRATTGSINRVPFIGLAKQASALPLPSTMTPIAPTSDYVPLLMVSVR